MKCINTNNFVPLVTVCALFFLAMLICISFNLRDEMVAFAQTSTSRPPVATSSSPTTPAGILLATLKTPDAIPLTDCSIYTSASPLPVGYGSPFYVVTNPASRLVEVYCGDSYVGVGAGTGATNEYVYNRGYVYLYGTWQPIQLTGIEPRDNGTWFMGSAIGSLYIGSTEMKRIRWAVAYVCTYQSALASWKCGCRDAACTTSGWQIQMFANY